jgi:hypothetical protein
LIRARFDLSAFLAAFRVFFRSRLDTSLEILAPRQKVAVLKRKRPRPSLNVSTASSGPFCGKYGRDGRMS